jgi:ABC-type phosphate transport system auxiliary subunit
MNNIASWIWVLIPITAIVMGIGSGIAKRWIKMKEREMQVANAMTAEKAAQYAAHTERLEQRVRVLERIVTDKGIGVADEIERLRDDRPN